MKELLSQNQYRLLAILLLLGNFYLLPIIADEAYYFSWGKHISWGYFDHPPLIGWITSLTNSSTLRIPFLFATMLFVILAKEQHLGKLLFVPGVHLLLGGALPDTLIVLSGFLVIYSFKKWLSDSTVTNAVILGITIAILGYSKFHGILLVFSLAIGFWSKRGERSLYLAIVVAAIALTPYLVWQSENNWITFTYHFRERFHTTSIQSAIEFFGITLLLWWPILIHFKKMRLWAKSLVILSLVLFGLGAYKGSVEIHWLLIWIWIIPEIPLRNSPIVRQMTYVLVLIHCLFWIPNVRRYFNLELHFRPEIYSLDTNMNTVFLDSYQDAALFEYKTSKKSYSLAHPAVRLSQYNLTSYPFNGKQVVVYNRMGMGKELSDSPFHFVQDTLYDLSKVTYSWNSGRLEIDHNEIPVGYNWVLYSYENGQQLKRKVICKGQTEPIFNRDTHLSQFLTLEKNWLPSGLWIPL
ncbi:MAG: hypothetical protein VXY91_01625 [Bacteroidota bacterium]|nr:hypothetical protein [Bacteroidota bacterium]